MSISQSELQLARLFKIILDGEKQLESYRQFLIDQPCFDPYLTFNMLAQSSQGYISPIMIANFLKKHGTEVLQVDLIIFFNSFDFSGDCQLSYTHFLNIIVPRNGVSFSQLSVSKDYSRTPTKKKSGVSYEIQCALARVLEKQISFIKKMELIKKNLAKTLDLTLTQIFSSIDTHNTGIIDIETLYSFLKKTRVTTSEDDTVILFRSMDHDNDDQLSYTEFMRTILPASLLTQNNNTITVKNPVPIISARRSSTPLGTRHRPPTRSSVASPRASPHQPKQSVDSSNEYQSLATPYRRYSVSDKCSGDYVRYCTNVSISMNMNKENERYESPCFPKQMPEPHREHREHREGIRPANSYLNKISNANIENNVRTISKSPIRACSDWSATTTTPSKRGKLETKEESLKVKDKAVQEAKLNEEDERDMAIVFRELINLDRETEHAKNELALRSDFNIVDIFRAFDIEARGFIDKYELRDGLSLFQIFPTEKEIELILKKFDKDLDGMLRCSDFCTMLTPVQGEYASIIKNKMAYTKTAKRTPETLSVDTMCILRRTLQTIISNESFCECLKQRLHAKRGFSLYKAFKTLDRMKNGFVCFEDLRDLMNSNDFSASQKELQRLMLRFDSKQSGRATYNEFVEEMKPKTLLTEEV